jgi:TolB-like protein
MAQLVGNLKMCVAWGATLIITSCASSQPLSSEQVSIVVAPFEVLGDAPVTLAESMRRDLAARLDLAPCVAARTDREDSKPSANYVLRGSAYAEGQLAHLSLQLADTATSERLWFEAYDYRGITAEMMADDIVSYLKTTAPGTGRSRLTTGCSGP